MTQFLAAFFVGETANIRSMTAWNPDLQRTDQLTASVRRAYDNAYLPQAMNYSRMGAARAALGTPIAPVYENARSKKRKHGEAPQASMTVAAGLSSGQGAPKRHRYPIHATQARGTSHQPVSVPHRPHIAPQAAWSAFSWRSFSPPVVPCSTAAGTLASMSAIHPAVPESPPGPTGCAGPDDSGLPPLALPPCDPKAISILGSSSFFSSSSSASSYVTAANGSSRAIVASGPSMASKRAPVPSPLLSVIVASGNGPKPRPPPAPPAAQLVGATSWSRVGGLWADECD